MMRLSMRFDFALDASLRRVAEEREVMAEIISLEQRRRLPATAPSRSEKPAAIVFFPGVRYERPREASGDARAVRKRRPRKAN